MTISLELETERGSGPQGDTTHLQKEQEGKVAEKEGR